MSDYTAKRIDEMDTFYKGPLLTFPWVVSPR